MAVSMASILSPIAFTERGMEIISIPLQYRYQDATSLRALVAEWSAQKAAMMN